MAFWRNLDLSATYSPTTTEHNATSSSTQDRHDQTSSESNRYDQHFLTSNSGNVSSSTNITDASDRSNFTSTNSNSESVNFYTNIIDSNVQMPTGGSSAVIVGMNRPEPPMFYSYNYSGASAPPASFYYGPQASHPLMQPRTVYPQRLALIISNYSDFENEKYEDRKGNEKDVVRLKVTLTWFGFTFREFHNKKKKAILDAVEAFTNEDHKDLACVMVIVLTHGNSGGLLCAKDDDYHTKDIWKPFCDCEALKNVPKIFIFQACRGNEIEVRCYSSSSTNVPQELDEKPRAVQVVPQYPGFLLAHSSIAEHKSMRNEETGAIFIQAFCDQLEAAAEHETPTDILSILTEVNSMVAVAAESNRTSQTSTFTSFLHQPFYLKGTKHPNVIQQTAARSRIRYDSAGTRRITYDKKGTRNVLILYTETFTNQVKTLQDALENQGFCIEELHFDENIVATLSEMSSGKNFEDAGSLTVFVLGEVQTTVSPDRTCEKLYVKTSAHTKIPLSAIWSHFTATKCLYLRSKPKLFFFCDLLERSDNYEETTAENVCLEPVNNHSDFLWTYCYGKKMFDALTSAMFAPQEEITQMLTTAMRKAGASSESGTISHFESTLRLQFYFHPSQQF